MRFALFLGRALSFSCLLLIAKFSFFPRLAYAFPGVVIEEVSSVTSLADALHHGVRLKIQPITDPNLLFFKVEVSKDNGVHWYVYSEKTRPYDARNLLLPYRGSRYAFATGQDYQIRVCAVYGTETPCAISSTFRLPSVTMSGAAGTTDTDDDILTAEREYNLGTDPRNPDSDNDQMADHLEVARGIDPTWSQRPEVTLNVSSLSFGEGDPFGSNPGQHQILTVANRGERVLRVSNGLLTGPDATEFRYYNEMLEVREILPYQTMSVPLDFLPTALGNRQASLNILSDDLAHFPTSVALSGFGRGIAQLVVEATEQPLQFGVTPVGESSEAKTIAVSNPDSDRDLAKEKDKNLIPLFTFT